MPAVKCVGLRPPARLTIHAECSRRRRAATRRCRARGKSASRQRRRSRLAAPARSRGPRSLQGSSTLNRMPSAVIDESVVSRATVSVRHADVVSPRARHCASFPVHRRTTQALARGRFASTVPRRVDERDQRRSGRTRRHGAVLKRLLDRDGDTGAARCAFGAGYASARQPEATLVQPVVDDDLANRAGVRPEFFALARSSSSKFRSMIGQRSIGVDGR